MSNLYIKCLIVGEGSIIYVTESIAQNELQIREAIVRSCSSICQVDSVKIFKLSNPCLSFTNSDAIDLARMDCSQNLKDKYLAKELQLLPSGRHDYNKATLRGNEFQLLVQLPTEVIEKLCKSNKRPGINLYRKVRWLHLHELLFDKQRLCKSYASYFERMITLLEIKTYTQPSEKLNIKVIDDLYIQLADLSRLMGRSSVSFEEDLDYYIFPILVSICSQIKGDIGIEMRKSVRGLEWETYFDYVIKCGSDRVCILKTKKDDLREEICKAIIGCEVVAETERLAKVYGIVTNSKDWFFIKNHNEKCEMYEFALETELDVPTRSSVQKLAEKLYASLCIK